MGKPITVYIAGPAVFRRDAFAYSETIKQRCRDLGLTALWPPDNVPRQTGDRALVARDLREMNCAMIRKADAVVADISPFRGPNMDPGTAFEIGYALALEKPLFLYTSSRHTLLERTMANIDLRKDGEKFFDVDDMEVEDFDLAENLMIATCAHPIFRSADDALIAASRLDIQQVHDG